MSSVTNRSSRALNAADGEHSVMGDLRSPAQQQTEGGLADGVKSTNVDYSSSNSAVAPSSQGMATSDGGSTVPSPPAESTRREQANLAGKSTQSAKSAPGSGKIPWTPAAVFCWFLLGIIRGTTSIMLALAGDDIQPTVIVLLRSPGTVGLFVLVMVVWSLHDDKVKDSMRTALTTRATYWKLCVLGVIQSGGPFLLFTYGLSHVPASFGGAFMALTPVWTVIVDQAIFKPLGFKAGKVNALKIMGMVTVVIGIAVYIIPIIAYDYTPAIQAECNNANTSHTALDAAALKRICASGTQIGVNIVELLCGAFLFGLAAVFWRNFKGSIHFTLAGGGQTVVGGIIALIFWAALNDAKFDPNWTAGSISALVYLMVLSGFGAAMLLFYLYGKIGAVPTARVMCLVPVVSWIEDRLINIHRGTHGIGTEAAGLVILIIGLILFEGRVDQICGFDVPCVKMYQRRQELNRFTASLRGDAENKARGLSTRLMEDEFEAVEVEVEENGPDDIHEHMAKYSSGVGDFEVVF